MESKRHINYHARQTILKEREKKDEVLGTCAGSLMLEIIRKSKCLIAGRVSLLKQRLFTFCSHVTRSQDYLVRFN